MDETSIEAAVAPNLRWSGHAASSSFVVGGGIDESG
jgi:hypothetical protein